MAKYRRSHGELQELARAQAADVAELNQENEDSGDISFQSSGELAGFIIHVLNCCGWTSGDLVFELSEAPFPNASLSSNIIVEHRGSNIVFRLQTDGLMDKESKAKLQRLTELFKSFDASKQDKLLALGEKLKPKTQFRKTAIGWQPLVKASPKNRYDGRANRREKIVDFIKRQYSDWLNGSFTRADLRFVDDSADVALRDWEYRYGEVPSSVLKLPKQPRPRYGDLTPPVEGEDDPIRRVGMRRLLAQRKPKSKPQLKP